MVKYIIGLFFLIYAQQVCAQTFYVAHDGGISHISIKGDKVTDQIITTCNEIFTPSSIAVYKNTLYTVNSVFLGKGVISGNKLINCTPFNLTSYGGNSLTVDDKGFFYTTWADTLMKIDPDKGTKTVVGVVPFWSAGDLVFYNKTLYMASTVGIVKINLEDTSKSQLIIPSDITFWGITTAAVSSTQNKVYAMQPYIFDTTIYELDMENNKLGKVVAVLPYIVLDAASYEESGGASVLEITQIKQLTDCADNGTGTIEIITRENLSDYRYTLDGVTNSTGIFKNVPSGNHTVTVNSDVESKTISFKAEFKLLKPQTVVTAKNPVCTDPGKISISAIGDASDYKIRLNNINYDINHVFENLTAGSYHFFIINENGCIVDKKDVTLTQDFCKIAITKVNVAEECNNPGKARVEVITSPHTEVYSFTMGNESNTTGIFNNVTAGNKNIHISSSNSDIKDVVVNVPDFNSAKPILLTIKNDANCDAPGSISFSIQTANASQYKVKYNGALYTIDKVFTGLVAGNYHFTILKPDGCIFAEKDISLTRQLCVITITDVNVAEECDDPGKAMINIATASHNDVYTYSLGNLPTNNKGIFRNVVPGNYKITIKSAEDEKNVDVMVPDYNASKPAVQYVATNLLCDEPAIIQLSVQGLNTASYKVKFTNNLYAFDHVFQVTAAGKYHFEIIKPDGCIYSIMDVPITRNKCEIELLTPTVKQECDVAYKGSVQINSKQHTYAYTYKIDNGPSNTSGLFNNLEPGNYNVLVSSIEDSKQISVTIPDYKTLSPKVAITKIDAECDLQGLVKFGLSSNSNGYTIKQGTSIFPFDHDFKLREGEHSFTVFKPDGCVLDSYIVDLKKLPCDVMAFPNAFTPNGDGINDVFQPNQGSDAVNYNLKIYNRNGMLLFNTNALQNGWRGEYNGSPVNAGVYYWVVTYTNNNGKNLNKSGSVTLIR